MSTSSNVGAYNKRTIQEETSPEYEAFEDLTRRLVAVPKPEVDAKRASDG